MAQHQSPKLADIVHQMLKVSDNNTAETLLRMTALGAGRSATFEDGAAVVRGVLSDMYGISLDNFEIYDGSGLSRANRIPATDTAEILDRADRVALRETSWARSVTAFRSRARPAARSARSGAASTTPDSSCAVGKVQAKTGTLTGAIALSGLTQGTDGRWKIFSFVENGSTASGSAIKDAMDGLAATVNGCWARPAPPGANPVRPKSRSRLRPQRAAVERFFPITASPLCDDATGYRPLP